MLEPWTAISTTQARGEWRGQQAHGDPEGDLVQKGVWPSTRLRRGIPARRVQQGWSWGGMGSGQGEQDT